VRFTSRVSESNCATWHQGRRKKGREKERKAMKKHSRKGGEEGAKKAERESLPASRTHHRAAVGQQPRIGQP
jgi:hypothetical protein